MYATGNQCPLGQCIQFTTRSCMPCDSTFSCDELTTPDVSCNDSAHFLGTTAVIRCVILDTSFNSLNITFRPEQSQNEEYVGEIFPDGQIQSLPQSPVALSANFDLSPKILMFTFQLLECSSRGRYRIIAGGTNSSVAPSVETFELTILGNLTEFEMHIEPAYPEGTLVKFNCTASLDESHANIKGYYKKELGSSFSEIKGTTTVIERNLFQCFVKVLRKPSTPFTADTSFNNADLKCDLVDWPLVQPSKQISIQNADVAFETYKLESFIGSQVSVKCLARNTNSIKSIFIRKIENPLNTIVANVTLPDMTYHVDGTSVSYTNKSLTLTFSSLTCSDDGNYTCIVIKEDESQIESPAYLRVQLGTKPANPTLDIDYNWTEGTSLGTHSCTGRIGNPPGTMTLEIRDGETGNFTSFSPSTKSLTTTKENCHYNAQLTFSINSNTEHIQSHYIRCVANNQHTLLISESPFYSREVFVSPLPANACFEDGLHPYPGDCTRFLNCYRNNTGVTQCPSRLCFETSYCGTNCTGCNA